MDITQRILFHLLEAAHHITAWPSESCSVSITSATIYENRYLDENMLYIVPQNVLPEFRFYYGNAWIFLLSDPSAFSISDKYRPYSAVISDNTSPIRLLEEIFNLIIKLHRWDGQLKNAIANQAPIKEIFRICQLLLPFPMIIINKDFRVISYSEDYFRHVLPEHSEKNKQHVPFDTVNDLLSDPNFLEAQNEKTVFIYSQTKQEPLRVCYNIFHNENYTARLILHSRTSHVSLGELDLFRHMAAYIQRIYIQFTGAEELYHQNDTLHRLCRSLILKSDSIAVSDMERILADYKWSMKDTYQIYCIQFTGLVEFHSIANFLQQALEDKWKNSCMIPAENRLIWVVNLTWENLTRDTTRFHKELTYTIRELICKAGVSNCFNNFYYLLNYYRQADIALTLGSKKDPHFWLYQFQDYVLDYVRNQLELSFTPEQLAHPGIVRLIQYDQNHETQYIETIRQYIEAKFNASQAANGLYIHRTTFLKRLERIETIAGIHFENSSELIYILVSFLILNLL